MMCPSGCVHAPNIDIIYKPKTPMNAIVVWVKAPISWESLKHPSVSRRTGLATVIRNSLYPPKEISRFKASSNVVPTQRAAQHIQPISQLLSIHHTLFLIDATYTAKLHSDLWQLAFTISRLADENSRWHGRKHAEDCGNVRRCKHRIR